MTNYQRIVRKALKKVPGERYFGVFRFLPLFYVAGAALEFVMINWHVGEVNFYKTYKKRQIESIVERKFYELRQTNEAVE